MPKSQSYFSKEVVVEEDSELMPKNESNSISLNQSLNIEGNYRNVILELPVGAMVEGYASDASNPSDEE